MSYLYALRSMKRSGALSSGSHSILLTCEEIVEYANAFFANSPLFLSDTVERVQRRALRITLWRDRSRHCAHNRREKKVSACRKFICTLTCVSLVYKLVKSCIPADVMINHLSRPRNEDWLPQPPIGLVTSSQISMPQLWHYSFTSVPFAFFFHTYI